MQHIHSTDQHWEGLDGANLAYVHEQYERYLQNPDTVVGELRELFIQWGEPPLYAVVKASPAPIEHHGGLDLMKKAVLAAKLVQHIRTYGHLQAKVNSLTDNQKAAIHSLEFTDLGLTKADLQQIPAEIIWEDAPQDVKTGWDAISYLWKVYSGPISYQFTHIHDAQQRAWLNQKVEATVKGTIPNEQRQRVLKKLTEVEEFEHFLHKTFAGQKRFSIEGLDMLIPMLDETIRNGASDGVKTVLIGMAHRGRLNVLAHVLQKPYGKIFSEFYHNPTPDLVPSEGSMGINYGWTGDVKYHLGADQNYENVQLILANNPSHLEFVGSIIQGYTRAAQDDRRSPGQADQDVSQAFSIIVHGDAAFPGEGIVAETLNLSRLKGYNTGGTIHIIANNQIGFTTDSKDSRSTIYASDLAKGFQIPIVHVNADDPEACIQAMELAYAYRKQFHSDFLVDLIGFRRYGHNEMDDPATTQPVLYKVVDKHLGVRSIYAEVLRNKGLITGEQAKSYKIEIQSRLKEALDVIKKEASSVNTDQSFSSKREQRVLPSVSVDTLNQINNELLQWPADFNIYPKLGKILQRRGEAFAIGGKADWATSEALAFATILREGTPIRLTGQDSERGTFAHRHLVLHDQETGDTFIPLHQLSGAKASFAVYNSALSEAAVMGFEYGYDVFSKDTLVLWEAQFGDFVNAAQVIIDTFLVAGRAKWRQNSNLVLLLPHGYEGQGPEHSSARPERFLQLAAEGNMMIANPTSSAQYYHLLRRQASLLGTENRCPLIIFTPKGLLRHPQAASSIQELAEGTFKPILEKNPPAKDIKRLILCSGKIAVELQAEQENVNGVHIARIEQLYPFPEKELRSILDNCTNLEEICWVQEEPHNMGAWSYIKPRIQEITPIHVRYIGRPDRSSPAEGLPDIHKREQQRIVREALQIEEGGRDHD